MNTVNFQGEADSMSKANDIAADMTAAAQNSGELWSFARLHRKLTSLIRLFPMVAAGDPISRGILKDMQAELV